MATQMVPTASQEAYASVLLARSARWARGYRNSDGLQFVLFASSRTLRDGTPIYHMTSQEACTCPGFQYRGACSHQLAVAREAERAREQVTRRATYEELYPDDEYGTVSAF
jgi:hypothetical protein